MSSLILTANTAAVTIPPNRLPPKAHGDHQESQWDNGWFRILFAAGIAGALSYGLWRALRSLSSPQRSKPHSLFNVTERFARLRPPGQAIPHSRTEPATRPAPSSSLKSAFERGARVVRPIDPRKPYVLVHAPGDGSTGKRNATEAEYQSFRAWELTEYDQLANRLNKTVSGNGVEHLMKKFLTGAYQRTPTAEAVLKDPALRPTTVVRSGHRLFFFGTCC